MIRERNILKMILSNLKTQKKKMKALNNLKKKTRRKITKTRNRMSERVIRTYFRILCKMSSRLRFSSLTSRNTIKGSKISWTILTKSFWRTTLPMRWNKSRRKQVIRNSLTWGSTSKPKGRSSSKWGQCISWRNINTLTWIFFTRLGALVGTLSTWTISLIA